MDVCLPNVRRGGSRPGSVRPGRVEMRVRIRMKKSQHDRWSKLKSRKGLVTDDDVARYFLDLEDTVDQFQLQGEESDPSMLVICGVEHYLEFCG